VQNNLPHSVVRTFFYLAREERLEFFVKDGVCSKMVDHFLHALFNLAEKAEVTSSLIVCAITYCNMLRRPKLSLLDTILDVVLKMPSHFDVIFMNMHYWVCIFIINHFKKVKGIALYLFPKNMRFFVVTLHFLVTHVDSLNLKSRRFALQEKRTKSKEIGQKKVYFLFQ